MSKLKIALWDTWNKEQKHNAMLILGIGVAIFAIFTLISMVSYLFSWEADQSLLSDPEMMSIDADASNMAGKWGIKWSHTLISTWFGLGSFAIIIFIASISLRILGVRRKSSILKVALATFSCAVISSMILSLAGNFLGISTILGSGLGGRCGSYIISRIVNLCGAPITAMICAASAFIWLLLCCNPFSRKINSISNKQAQGKCDNAPSKPETVEEATDDELEPTIGNEQEEFGSQSAIEEQVEYDSVAEDEVIVEEQEAVIPEKVAGVFEIDRGDSLTTDISAPLPRIDVRLDPPEGLPDYRFPGLDILEDHSSTSQAVSDEELNRNNNKIRSSLKNYKIEVVDVKAVVGPTVTLYKVYPAPGVKISTIKSLQDDIAMSLNAKGVRIVTLPDSVGIEVANDRPSTVPVKALLNDEAFRESKADLPIAIGCTIQKKVKVFDLADAPHLLVAGATKQGKSVGLNVLIASLLYSKHPSELKMVFIDPKMVEFSAYSRLLKHYLAVLPDSSDDEEEKEKAIVKNPKDAEKILRSLCTEMDDRYQLLSKAYVNNIKLYNDKYKDHKLNPENGHRFLPYLVVIIDEYADLAMSGGSGSEAKNMQRSIMTSIVRLAQKGRAAGLHVVIATQRPSVDVITGLIKANFPARIAFRVSTRVDSNTILDNTGAEKLIGRGDMLYYAGVETERIQCGFISNEEINTITTYIGEQQGYKKSYNIPYYLPSPEPSEGEGGSAVLDMSDLDERFEEAARQVVMSQRGSTSDIQRKLGMGYARAGKVMDQLEGAGIVAPQEGSKPRQVLVSSLEELETILDSLKH